MTNNPADKITSLENEAQLLREIIARHEDQSRKQAEVERSLQERLKELSCLFGLTRLINTPGITEGELLQAAVDLLPPAWQYPEAACARIQFGGREYKSKHFQESAWQQQALITVGDQPAGSLEVFYLHELPLQDEDPFLKEERALIDAVALHLGRYLERKQASDELEQIKWMLSGQVLPGEEFTPGYGDLSELNTNGLIINNVERSQLRDIVSEYLDLLGSSVAVYELDGDYALGIFSSGWCQMMDTASRRLCRSADNQQALNSGKWLCHESCWKDASLEAIAQERAIDVECNGGIRLYAVPVRAGEKVVGAINFGYGDPPADPKRLEELSRKYKLPLRDLQEQAAAYPSRPGFVIEYAKRRLQKASSYLGYIIDRSLAGKAFRDSEENLLITLNSIGDGVIATDLDGRITGMNPVAENLTGWSAEESAQQKLQDVFRIVNAKTGKVLQDPVEKVLKTGAVVGLANHTKLISRDGSEYFISDSGAPITDADGTIRGVVLVFRNVTESYQMIEKIKESEERFRGTLDSLLEGCQIISPDWRYLYLNDAVADHARQPKARLMGQSMLDIFPEQDNPDLYRRLCQCMEKRIPVNLENEFEYPDGSTGWYELSIQPVPEGLFILSVDISKRKQAERALKESKELYQGRIWHLMEGFYCATLDGSLLEYNKEFINILGLDPGQDYTGLGLPDFWQNPGDRKDYLAQLETKGYVRDYLILARKATGQLIVLRANASLSRSEDGTPLRIEGSFLDDTLRTQMQEQLKHSEEKYHLIADNSIDCIWQLDRRLRFTYLSPSLYQIAGFRPEEWIGSRIFEHTTTKEFLKMARLALKMLKNPRELAQVRFETAMYNKAGELVPLEIAAQPLIIHGVLAGLQGSTRDIRERKEAERKLQEKEQFLGDIIQAMTDGLSILDPAGKHLAVNPALSAMTGFEEKELIGVGPPHPYWPEEEYGNIQAALIRVHQGDAAGIEAVFMKKSGERFPVLISPGQVRDEEGNPLSSFAVVRDISDQKQAEDELRRAKGGLEDQVKKQTAELQARLAELERFHDATIEREFRIKELRDEIALLKGEKQ